MARDPRLRDKWWRLTNLYKIKDKEGNLVTFEPNETQLQHLAERGDRKRGRILKYRQGGFTTLYCIDYLDDALWTPGFTAAIIAHERETLDKIFQIIKRAYDNLPESLRPTTRQDTLRMLRFESAFDGLPLDSAIYVAMKLRGGTVQALHVSERAHIEGEQSQELEAGSKQAVPISGRISEETTANGMNDFYEGFMRNWNKSTLGDLDYYSYFYAWHEHGEYTLPGTIDEYTPEDLRLKELVRQAYNKELTDGQLLWYRWKHDEMKTVGNLEGLRPEQLMKQEYPSTVLEAFQSGLGNVFNLEMLDRLQPAAPIRTTSTGIRIWKEPIKRGDRYINEDGQEAEYSEDRKYVMGGDPGGGGDLTVLDIWDPVTGEQVAQWSGLDRADEAAEVAHEMCLLYNNAFAGIENNMLSLILFLSKLYDNLYSTTVIDEKFNRQTRKIGWNTNAKTRDPMIDEFLMKLTVSQMKTFVKKDNGKREHADGKHDDAVIAAMIAVQMFKFYQKMDRYRTRVWADKPSGF
jgi:hypothetical protein